MCHILCTMHDCLEEPSDLSPMINVGKCHQSLWKEKFHWVCAIEREELANNTNRETSWYQDGQLMWKWHVLSRSSQSLKFPRRQKSQGPFAQERHPRGSEIYARFCPIRTQLHRQRQEEKVIQEQQCRGRMARLPDVWVLGKHFPSLCSEACPGLWDRRLYCC